MPGFYDHFERNLHASTDDLRLLRKRSALSYRLWEYFVEATRWRFTQQPPHWRSGHRFRCCFLDILRYRSNAINTVGLHRTKINLVCRMSGTTAWWSSSLVFKDSCISLLSGKIIVYLLLSGYGPDNRYSAVSWGVHAHGAHCKKVKSSSPPPHIARLPYNMTSNLHFCTFLTLPFLQESTPRWKSGFIT